jgi:type 1 glutamine amidotransferase
MLRIISRITLLVILFTGLQSSNAFALQPNDKTIKVLILSGYGNHEWKKTTPILIRIFDESKLFVTQVNEKPESLTYAELKKYNLVVCNANTWPDNNLRLSPQWEADFTKYINEGGGALFFHAGASSFYGWEDFFRIGIGRWGKETNHNAPVVAKLYGMDQKHPITKGLKGFQIMDEIWENTELYPGAKAIGSLKAANSKDGHPIDEPAIFVNQTGKGRSFFTILGHDERALVNSGLKALLLRAAQWCAGREVTISAPAEIDLNKINRKPVYKWNETDTTLALVNNKDVVWQFNYNDRFRKPYFHPLAVNNIVVTSLSPPDHPWHLGLWFSWKYINHVNYWEYMSGKQSAKAGYRSEGATEIVKKEITRHPDFSAHIKLWINYHPQEGGNVMTEERSYHVSAPSKNGNYEITQDYQFKVVADSVVLNRTIPAIRGGRIQGGYAGISCRFNQDFTSPEIRNPVDSAICQKCNWQYYGFLSLSGKRVGMKIELDPQHNFQTCRWYVINDPLIPFFFYSPGVVFDDKVTFRKGENFRLKYRIQMMEGEVKLGSD